MSFRTKIYKQKEMKLNTSIIMDVSAMIEILHTVTPDKEKLVGPLFRSK